MKGSLSSEEYMLDCNLPTWVNWLTAEASCYKVDKTFRHADRFFSHCCDRGEVSINPDSIELFRHADMFWGASRWLHIISGLYVALSNFTEKQSYSYITRTGKKKLQLILILKKMYQCLFTCIVR